MGSPVSIIGNFSRTNYLINGAFDFAQRIGGTTTNLSTAPVYYIDRWQSWYSATSWASIPTITLVAVSPATPPGIARYTPGTGGTSSGGGAAFYHQQKIEAIHARELANQKVSVGFWVFPSSVNCSAQLSLNVAVAEDDWSSSSNFYTSGQSQTLIAGVWNYVSFKNISMPSNAWQGINVQIVISNFAAVGVVGCYITEFMMNIGPVVTPFIRKGSTIQGELALCQRYCIVVSGSANQRYGVGVATDNQHVRVEYHLPVTMRRTPSPSYTAPNTFIIAGAAGNIVCNNIGDNGTNSTSIVVTGASVASGLAANAAVELTGNSGLTATMILDAEIA